MKDSHGNEFTRDTVHCFNCKYYKGEEDNNFSFCLKQKLCLPMVQLKKLNEVFCHFFENKKGNES